MALASATGMAIGNHIWFIPDGTAFTNPTSGTSGRDSKPDAADTCYSTRKLAIVEDVDVDPGISEPIDIMEPSPGALALYDQVYVGHKAKWTFNVSQVDALALGLVFNAGTLTGSSTQFNPGEGTGFIKGWLKYNGYDSGGTKRVDVEVYGTLRLNQPLKMDPKALTKPAFIFTPLRSIYNTGTL